MSYQDFFELFKAEVANAGLEAVFTDAWLHELSAALPTDSSALDVPEFAFFATALQKHADWFGDPNSFSEFMADVAAKVTWVKSRPGGVALCKKLTQGSLDGPISALLEIYTAWKLEHDAGVVIAQLEPLLPDGKKKLDAEATAGSETFLVECFASLGSGFAQSGALEGYWSPETDPIVVKICGKILNKAEQAASATEPVVVVIAPSADFLMPPEKIPVGVNLAFSDPKATVISAVVFTGGSHTCLCESLAVIFPNPNAAKPLGPDATAALKGLLR